jgi:hypothetical protein
MLLSVFLASVAVAYPQQLTRSAVLGEWQAPTETDDRSPCPALNSLANHGFFPRNGRNISIELMEDALVNVFGVGDSVNKVLFDGSAELRENGVYNLNAFRKHNVIEHDASLVHLDTHFGPNWVVQQDKVNDLVAMANGNDYLDATSLGKYRRKLTDTLSKSDPEWTYGFKQEFLALSESSFLLLVLGDGNKVSVEYIKTFLGNEQIPDGFVPRDQDNLVTFFQVLKTNSHIKLAAGLW